MNSILKKPSAWLPIAMSLSALGILIGYFVFVGPTQEEDEGTAAHLFQILMGGQVFIIGFFLIKWLPEKPKQALQILALQILVALLPFTLLFVFEHTTVFQPSVKESTDLNSIFELDKKEPSTQLFYSDKLGVGFTYLPYSGYEVPVTESGNRIDIVEQHIEVFTKDPSLTLAQAIETQFLQGYDSKDCFVKMYDDHYPQGLNNYVTAGISYPTSDDPNFPWWRNGENCPQYSETNGGRYFVMNTEVPGKFLFIELGQAGVALDGTSYDPNEGGFDWSHSVRILK